MQESAEARAAAAHRRAVERVVGKAREEARIATRPSSRARFSAGARMDAEAEREVPVRRARRGRAGRDRGTAPGRDWPRRCRASRAIPRGSATPPIIASARVDMRLPSWFELSKRRNSSTAVSIERRVAPAAARAGRATASARAARCRSGWSSSRGPALSRKMHCAAARSRSAARRRSSPCDEPRQHVGVGVARMRAPLVDQRAQVGGHLDDRPVAARRRAPASAPARARRGSRATSARSGPRSRVRHAEQVADDLDRNRAPRTRRSGRRRRRSARRVEQAARRARRAPAPSRRCARCDSAPTIARRTRVCSGGSLKTRLVVWCS